MLYANGYPVGGGGGGSTEIIADDFDSTATYAVGDYCIYDGKLYKCTTAVSTAGQWDSNDWTETLVMDEVGQSGGLPNYSTTEHKTGRKWVDGKDIWECTTITHSNLPIDESWVDSGIEITGDVISVYGSIIRDNEPINLGGSFNSYIYSKWIIRNNKLLIGVNGSSGETYKINNITAQYTKSS